MVVRPDPSRCVKGIVTKAPANAPMPPRPHQKTQNRWGQAKSSEHPETIERPKETTDRQHRGPQRK